MGEARDPPRKQRRATDGAVPPIVEHEHSGPPKGRRGFERLAEPGEAREDERPASAPEKAEED